MADKQDMPLDVEQKLKEFLKIILEKYIEENLGSIIVSIAISLIIYFIIPNDHMVFIKLKSIQIEEKNCIIVFFIIIESIFIIIKSIIYIFAKIINKKGNKIYEKQIEELWSQIDKMSSKDYDLLLDFIQSENKPRYIFDQEVESSLLSSDWIYKKEISLRDESDRNYIGSRDYDYNCDLKIYKYILKDNIYDLLKYSISKYNRISHFKR